MNQKYLYSKVQLVLMLLWILWAGGPLTAYAVESYGVWVQGTLVTAENENDVLGDGKIAYDAKTQTLTLHDAVIEAGELTLEDGKTRKNAGIYATHNLCLQLQGANAITQTEPAIYYAYGILLKERSHLTIAGEGALEVTGNESTKNDSYGIYATDITIQSGRLVLKGGKAGQNSWGLYCYSKGKLIINGGEVLAEGGLAGAGKASRGMRGETITVTGGTLVAKGDNTAMMGKVDVTSYPDLQVMVSDVKEGTAAVPWDGKISLGSGSPYRYVAVGPKTYAVKVTTDARGSAKGVPSEAKEKETFTLEATAVPGYVFDRWEVRAGTVTLEDAHAAKTAFAMPAEEVEIQALFRRLPPPPTPFEPEEPATPDPSMPADGEATRQWQRAATFDWGFDEMSASAEGETGKDGNGILEIKLTIGTKRFTQTMQDGVKVHIMDVEPYIKNGRTMVPVRFVAEALSFTVKWDQTTKSVELKNEHHLIRIPVMTGEWIVDGKVYHSDVACELKDERTFIAVGNLARALGLRDGEEVLWNETTREVTIRPMVR